MRSLGGFEGEGSGVVEKASWQGERVYINDTQYFSPVSAAVWEFYIGGYQPAQKWLKDRKDRALSYEDSEHYLKMLYALQQTITTMQEIDNIFEG